MKYALMLACGLLLPLAAQAQDAAPAADTASYIEGASWTYPSLTDLLRVNAYLNGDVMVDCAVRPDAHVNDCYAQALDDTTDKATSNGIGAVYQQRATVDPKSIDGGIQPGDRVQFHYDWHNLPSSDIDNAKALPVIDPALGTAGRWTYPDGYVMSRAFPEKAANAGIDDTVVIDCQIAADGTLPSCMVLADLRPDYGFAPATVALFLKYCRVDPKTVPGGIQPGGYHLFTYHWTLA